MKKHLVPLFAFSFCLSVSVSLSAQDSTNIRKGWTFGVLPSFAYDADLGLQLGLLSNVYYFGDGAVYPDYYHSFYVEAATTSKHYGLYRFAYDSKYLIPGHRHNDLVLYHEIVEHRRKFYHVGYVDYDKELTIFIGYVIVCENCYFKPHFDKL